MKKVLIVEDECILSQSLKSVMEIKGYEVDLFSTLEPVLATSFTNKYSLVILDLNLNVLPGDHLIKELRAAKDSVPIIVMTANLDVAKKIEVMNYGADDYITKPFELPELLSRIEYVIDGRNNS